MEYANGLRCLQLENYNITKQTGFLCPKEPLSHLPAYYEPWESLAAQLPSLIAESEIRQEVHQLPELDTQHLQSEDEWWRAYVVLTFLSQAYIWVEGDRGLPNYIPRCLAVPWWAVSQHLDMPPVITYACTALKNWVWLDHNQEVGAIRNPTITLTFTGTRDEEWFYIVPLLIEQAAAPALDAMIQAFRAMAEKDHPSMLQCLHTVISSLKEMRCQLKKMYDECDPKVFYNKVRPFQAGSLGLDSLPDGIIYEGVDDQPKKFSGASAAQSSTMPAFDTFLGVQHTGSTKEFLELQRKHMPPSHRQFLVDLAKQPTLRDYISVSGDTSLVKLYNMSLDGLAEFRRQHVIMVTRYIVNQKDGRNKSLEAKGTGGSDFMIFIKEVRDNTLSKKL